MPHVAQSVQAYPPGGVDVQDRDGGVVHSKAQPGLRGQLQGPHHEVADHIACMSVMFRIRIQRLLRNNITV